MSYLAVGSATKAMVELLTRKLNKPPLLGNGVTFRVTALPPDDDRVGEDTGVNLYLYKVAESAFLKNTPWRGDRSNPLGSRRPPLALTLNYLMTAYTKRIPNAFQDDIIAHQLLGDAMSIFHDNPVLNDIHDSDFDADLDSQLAPELRDAFEKIKINLLPSSIEEFSKIWTGLSKAYRLSVVYEVSLVEIAPQGASALPAPPPQRVSLTVTTIQSPAIVAIEPESVPAGSLITITGSGLTSPGGATVVNIGEVRLEQSELVRASANELVLAVPETFARGPKVAVTVEAGGRRSAPAVFTVQPWIEHLTPLRGLTGVPIRFTFDVPAGEAATATVDSVAAPLVVEPATKTVRVTVPAVTSNGPKPVVLTLTGPPARRSNALLYEVLPHITGFTLTSTALPVRTTVTISGERLKGKDVHVRYGGLIARKGENTNDGEVAVIFERALTPGGPVSVLVDGRESNVLPPRLDPVDPAEAFAGDDITLRGAGLSGAVVVVHLGATAIALGAHPFASQIPVTLPGTTAAGPLAISVTVDGADSNTVPLTVKA